MHLRGGGGSGGSSSPSMGSYLNSGLSGPGGLRRKMQAPPKIDDSSQFPSLNAGKADQGTNLKGFQRVEDQQMRGGSRPMASSGALSTANRYGGLDCM
jgi:hypothetical protein